MKRTHKLMITGATILGVVALGCVWLIRALFGIATDEVDGSLGETKNVQVGAKQPPGGSGKMSQPANVGGAESVIVPPQPRDRRDATAVPSAAPAAPAATPAPRQYDGGTKAAVDTHGSSDREESLGDMSGILSFFLNDGDSEALSPEALLNPSNKSADASAADGMDGLLRLIPGADSPTLKRWEEGRYQGRESQVVDDAIEDPKIWRLVFSLGGL